MGKLQLLHEEMKPYNCDILGLSEMYWTGKGELYNGEVIWSGEDVNHNKGVGLLQSNKAKTLLLGYKQVNSRIIAAHFKRQPLNLAVIHIYAPTYSSDNKIDEFYNTLESTLSEIPNKDVKIIMGD